MSPAVPTLYHIPYFSSSMPLQVLKELDVPESEFAVKLIDEKVQRTDPEFLKLSPNHKIPVVELPDGTPLLESGAIALYILEKFDHKGELHVLASDTGNAVKRAKILQGMFYAVAECYAASMGVFMLCHKIEKKDRDEKKLDVAKANFRKVVFDHLLKELKNGENDFYAGNQFTVADIMMGYMIMCAEYCDCELMDNAVINSYNERLKGRDSYTSVFPMDC